MKLAEIERDLKGRVHPNVIYHIARIQEELTATNTQLTNLAKLLEQVVDSLIQLRDVNLKLNDRWRKRLRGGNDVEIVESVLPDPTDRH